MEAGWGLRFEAEQLFRDVSLVKNEIEAMAGRPILDGEGRQIVVAGDPLHLLDATEKQYQADSVYALGGTFPGYEVNDSLHNTGDLAATWQLGHENNQLLFGIDGFFDDMDENFLVYNGSINQVTPVMDIVGAIPVARAGAFMSRSINSAGERFIIPAMSKTARTAQIQGHFWGGFSQNIGKKAAQRFGAYGYANMNYLRNQSSKKIIQNRVKVTEIIYGENAYAGVPSFLVDGAIRTTKAWTLRTGAVGVADGYFNFLDVGGPPAYLPSGAPAHVVSAPFFTGQAIGDLIETSENYIREIETNDESE